MSRFSFGRREAGVPGQRRWIRPTFAGNAFSIQDNTRFTGSNGHYDGVQFADQSRPGGPDAVCVWNVDITKQIYMPICVLAPVVHRGVVASDYPVIEGDVTAKGKLETLAILPWSSGVGWSVVTPDKYGLAGRWTNISGSVLGWGNSSHASFSSADVFALDVGLGWAPVCPRRALAVRRTESRALGIARARVRPRRRVRYRSPVRSLVGELESALERRRSTRLERLLGLQGNRATRGVGRTKSDPAKSGFLTLEIGRIRSLPERGSGPILSTAIYVAIAIARHGRREDQAFVRTAAWGARLGRK